MARKKLGLRTAGNRLDGQMGDLSDSLLGLENKAQFRMEGVFTDLLPDVAAALTARYSRSRKGMVITELAEEAVGGTRSAYGRLVFEALDVAADSMLVELTTCEETLGARYSGLAKAAVDYASGHKTRLASYSLNDYREQSLTSLEWFHTQVMVEMAASFSNDETEEDLINRLISPTPLRNVPGHRGRGLWWKPLEHCNRVSRETEFKAVNTFRVWCMNSFNELGKER